jgi:hypothetical protein
LDESEITLVVFDTPFATKTSPFPLSYATPTGRCPTETVATSDVLARVMGTTEEASTSRKRKMTAKMVGGLTGCIGKRTPDHGIYASENFPAKRRGGEVIQGPTSIKPVPSESIFFVRDDKLLPSHLQEEK